MRAKHVLSGLGIRPSKRRGQSFLTDSTIAQEVVSFSGVSKNEAVLEIGSGLGVLTGYLFQITRRLAVVELEEELCRYLREILPDLAERHIHCADIRNISAEKIAGALGSEHVTVVSNVPYSISSDVVLWVLTQRRHISRASLLLQKEFAERVAASPGGRDYGSLSVLRMLYAEAELGQTVPGEKFHPKAKVDSMLVKLVIREEPLVPLRDEEFFEQVVRASFAHRRKTLLNSLSAAKFLDSKKALERLLRELSIEPQRRAETLSVEEFAALSDALLDLVGTEKNEVYGPGLD